ncbi:MAG TPA: protein TolR, partial [Gammaproteobacteria bacterium]|nr:protein TolR [Gammaproteobacteria bacterium]
MSSRRRRRKLLSEINVVPYIDVMLVLLVVFMIAAPLMVQGILVNLPETLSEPLPREKSDPLIISIRFDGVFFLETQSSKDIPLNLKDLSIQVKKILTANPSLQVVVRGDGNVKYQ